MRMWIVLGAIVAGLSVVSGAFAAHSLTDHFGKIYAGQTRNVAGEEIPLARKYLQDFKTGAEYQMAHGLAILIVGVMGEGVRRSGQKPSCWLIASAVSFLVGVVLFSGSLYVLTLTGIRVLGAVTPFGGVAFLIGWGCLAMAALTSKSSAAHGS